MIILDETDTSLEVVLSSAVTTNQLDCVACWVDHGTNSLTPGANDTVTNSTTPVTLVSAPSASTYRQVRYISVYNKDTAAAVVTIQYENGASQRVLIKQTLNPGATLTYEG